MPKRKKIVVSYMTPEGQDVNLQQRMGRQSGDVLRWNERVIGRREN